MDRHGTKIARSLIRTQDRTRLKKRLHGGPAVFGNTAGQKARFNIPVAEAKFIYRPENFRARSVCPPGQFNHVVTKCTRLRESKRERVRLLLHVSRPLSISLNHSGPLSAFLELSRALSISLDLARALSTSLDLSRPLSTSLDLSRTPEVLLLEVMSLVQCKMTVRMTERPARGTLNKYEKQNVVKA